MANSSGADGLLANTSSLIQTVNYTICNQQIRDENPLVGYLTLGLTCMASWKIAFFVSDNARAISLPRGSGFLITGLIAGTFNLVKSTNKICQVVVMHHPDGTQYDERHTIFFPVRRAAQLASLTA